MWWEYFCCAIIVFQISYLQQQYASGCYTLQRPHRAPAEARKMLRHLTSTTKPITSRVPIEGVDGVDNEGVVEHVFELCVEGVRDVGAFASTVWGEADCFVQYHFPTLTSDEDEVGESLTLLRPFFWQRTHSVFKYRWWFGGISSSLSHCHYSVRPQSIFLPWDSSLLAARGRPASAKVPHNCLRGRTGWRGALWTLETLLLSQHPRPTRGKSKPLLMGNTTM